MGWDLPLTFSPLLHLLGLKISLNYICFITLSYSSVIPNIHEFYFVTGTSFMSQKWLFIDNLVITDWPINKDILIT